MWRAMPEPTSRDDGAEAVASPRAELPGDAAPPVEGAAWMRIKLAVWIGAAVLLLAGAALVARLIAGV